jgi:hypothetical protein
MATYRINVAKRIEKNVGKPFGPYYRHFFAAEIPSGLPEEVRVVLNDIRSRYPEPEFNVTCTVCEDSWSTFE